MKRPWIYSALLAGTAAVMSPLLLWKVAKGKYRESFPQRFGIKVQPGPQNDTVWIHACSVGEVEAIVPFVRLIAERKPETSLVISTVTETGQARARALLPENNIRYLPYDFLFAIRRHLDAVPRLSNFIIAETELWPNLIYELARRGIPVSIINGRISDEAWPRYRQARRFFSGVLNHLNKVAARTELDADRFRTLGADEAVVTGNIKYDRIEPAPAANAPEGQLVLFGSTHPGEEEELVRIFETLKADHPKLRAILAPRHIERARAIHKIFPHAQLRSDGWSDGDLFILDTHGELAALYRNAAVAVIGGSFVPIGGHNPLEPAIFGTPVVWGPHMENFRDACEALKGRGGFRADSYAVLRILLDELLSDETLRREEGAKGRDVVMENRGATEKTYNLIFGEGN